MRPGPEIRKMTQSGPQAQKVAWRLLVRFSLMVHFHTVAIIRVGNWSADLWCHPIRRLRGEPIDRNRSEAYRLLRARLAANPCKSSCASVRVGGGRVGRARQVCNKGPDWPSLRLILLYGSRTLRMYWEEPGRLFGPIGPCRVVGWVRLLCSQSACLGVKQYAL